MRLRRAYACANTAEPLKLGELSGRVNAGSTDETENCYTEPYHHSQKLSPPHRSPRQLCATNFPGGGPLKTKWPEKK